MKLYFANVIKNPSGEGFMLDGEHEINMPLDWDGDIEKYLANKYSEYPHSEDLTYYKEYPYSDFLDRNGIYGEEEVFSEFDDGDTWAMTLYYAK